MKFHPGIFVVVVICLLVTVPTVSASFDLGTAWNDFVGSLGLGSFFSGGSPSSGYEYSDSYTEYLTGRDTFVVRAGSNEQKTVEISNDPSGWTGMGCSASGSYGSTLASGLVKDNDQQTFSFSLPSACYRVIVKTYIKQTDTSFKTNVYSWREIARTWDYWGAVDEGHKYSCSDRNDKAYVRNFGLMSEDISCQGSAPDIASLKDGALCYSEGGSVYNDCPVKDEYGKIVTELWELEDGPNTGMKCCMATFTNYYGGDIDNGEVFYNGSVSKGLNYLFGGEAGKGLFEEGGALGFIGGLFGSAWFYLKWIILAVLLAVTFPWWFPLVAGVFSRILNTIKGAL
jgi:hypothetical protein